MNTPETDLTFFKNIKRLCSEKGISVTALGQELGLSNATTAGWRKGSQPRGKTLKMIADYFEVSIDQLVEAPSVTVNDNHGIIGNAHAPVTIVNGSEKKLTEQEVALLELFNKMDVIKQAQLLTYAADMVK